MIVDDLPAGILTGQQAPLASRAQPIEQGVDHCPRVNVPPTSGPWLLGEIGSHTLPLGISEISWIAHILVSHVLALFPKQALNRANADNPYLPVLRRARPALRLLELVRRQDGAHAVSQLYAALGTARHVHNADLGDPEVIRKAASDVGVDPSLVERALTDASIDAELEAQYMALDEHKVIGVPTLFIGDAAPVYGPVIDPVPSGDAARALWNDVSRLSQHPFFYELKRSR